MNTHTHARTRMHTHTHLSGNLALELPVVGEDSVGVSILHTGAQPAEVAEQVPQQLSIPCRKRSASPGLVRQNFGPKQESLLQVTQALLQIPVGYY